MGSRRQSVQTIMLFLDPAALAAGFVFVPNVRKKGMMFL
jgi:hypothetical protein